MPARNSCASCRLAAAEGGWAWRALYLAAALMTGLMTGCGSLPTPTGAPPLEGTAWVLSSLPGRALVSGAPATLSFEGGRAQGSDSCNRFGAPYTTRGSAFELSGRAMSTQMACPSEVMQQAQAFMAALGGAKSYRVTEGRLQLVAADGAVLATLAPQPKVLAGTAWRVTGYNNGRQAVVGVLAGTSVTLAFSPEGRATGLAGCNNFNAAYASDGAKLTIGPAAATRRMCAEPGVMEQEQQFLKALETVATARFEGERLELRTAGGALAVTATKDGGR
jgi:heat shock protein HslJ